MSELILPPSCCRDFRFRPHIRRRETSRIRAAGAWAAAEEEEGAGPGVPRPAVEALLGPGLDVTEAPRVPLVPPLTRASLTAPGLLWTLASSEIFREILLSGELCCSKDFMKGFLEHFGKLSAKPVEQPAAPECTT